MTDPLCQLYLITPPKFELVSFADKLAEAIDAGNVACVQLRLKEASDSEIMEACDVLRPIVQEREVAFILNDNPRLAAKMGCDGVHIGQEDGSYEKARDIVGDDAIVGVTCHNSRDLAFEAGELGADYVAFGAFFPTQTKEAKHQAELETLKAWNMMTTVPSVAIGGITVENCTPLVEAGADFLAVVAGVWDYPEGPGEAVRAFDNKIREATISL
ncbi:MAG: thiamine phosphate synthase [Rhodospirillales bacterium]|nr:thiamine phosphate synthase [Rhodospirillales bacterium]